MSGKYLPLIFFCKTECSYICNDWSYIYLEWLKLLEVMKTLWYFFPHGYNLFCVKHYFKMPTYLKHAWASRTISVPSRIHVKMLQLKRDLSCVLCRFFPQSFWWSSLHKSLLQFINSFPISREEAPRWPQCSSNHSISFPPPMCKCFAIKEHSVTLHILC